MKIQMKRGAIAAIAAMVLSCAGTASMAAESGATEGGAVPAGITVPKVTGMSDDFINGADFSTVLSLEASGVKFKNFAGQDADLFEVLSEAGVNYARVRVWNDPFLSTDPAKGYGAGNVNADRATIIGKRATEAGMKVLVNFHYSDFWAHPGQQYSPKSWRGLSNEKRAEALYDYTAQTLQQMIDAGVNIGMVQIGNETTGGEIAGVKGWENTAPLFKAGSKAVRDTLGDKAKVAVHFTNPERVGQYAAAAKELDNHGVDYDVFLSSYYAYWHGSLDNLTSVLDHVATTYKKEVAVAETSWGYTLEDGDGTTNSVTSDFPAYSTSVQGQALAVRDVMQAVANVKDNKGLGTFYWEPAWLPVGPPEKYESNWDVWQRDGSGWATSYSQEFYDPDGKLGDNWADDFGGSGWDNQALFAYDGTPHESLRVYKYARTGSIAPREVDVIGSPKITVLDGQTIELPAAVSVSYTDGTSESQDTSWDQPTEWVNGSGTYVFTGTTSAGLATTAKVVVLPESTDSTNYVVNPGFEEGVAPWTGTGTGFTISKTDDPFEGDRSTHFYSASATSFSIQQEITNVPPGSYRLSAKAQGDNKGIQRIAASSGISSVSAEFGLKGFLDWQTPQTDVLYVAADGVVTISAAFELSAGAWGTLDAFSLTAQQETEEVDSTLLRAQVAEAEEVKRNEFTEESIAALDQALARAQFVLTAPAASALSIEAALAQLEQALEGLVPVEDGPLPEIPGTDPEVPGTDPEQPGEKPGTDLPPTNTDGDDQDVTDGVDQDVTDGDDQDVTDGDDQDVTDGDDQDVTDGDDQDVTDGDDQEGAAVDDTDNLAKTGTNPTGALIGASLLLVLGAVFVGVRFRKGLERG